MNDNVKQAVKALPKVFIFVNGGWGEDMLNGAALSEDGTHLAGHCCSSRGFVEHDLGVYGPTWSAAEANLAKYAAHYPDGYELVSLADTTHAELGKHAEFMAAVARLNAKDAAEASTKAEAVADAGLPL